MLFSGETNSGKSHSLAIFMADLLKLFANAIRILTIENPKEITVDGVVHTILTGDLSTPEGIEAAWKASIMNTVRLDLDYLMIAELRDMSSALLAVQAALTGHGLMSTIHADEIFAILDRLFDFGVTMRRLCDPRRFTGLINQSLAPVLCTTCRRPFKDHYRELDDITQEHVREFCTPASVFMVGNNKNCPMCNGLGYTGRTLVAEVCLTNKRLLDIYRDDGANDARNYFVKEMNGITKVAHLIERINAGQVDPFQGESIVSLDEDKQTLNV